MTKGTRKIASKNPQEVDERENPSLLKRPYHETRRKKIAVLMIFFLWENLRISLGLVDLSRIPSGLFFREVHPGSEMASQNDQNKAKSERKLSNHDES